MFGAADTVSVRDLVLALAAALSAIVGWAMKRLFARVSILEERAVRGETRDAEAHKRIEERLDEVLTRLDGLRGVIRDEIEQHEKRCRGFRESGDGS